MTICEYSDIADIRAARVTLVVKNPPANAGDVRDVGSILDQEDFLEEGMATLSNILVWKIPWTEEPGRLYSPWVTKSWKLLKRFST